MGEELGGNEAKTTGHGQSVNVVISHGAGFWIAVALVAIVLLLAFTARAANKADLRSENAQKASENAATDFQVTRLYLLDVRASCQKAGVAMPPIPAKTVKFSDLP